MHAAVELDWLLNFTASAAAETASAMVAGFLDFVRSTSSLVFTAASNIGFIGFSPDCSHGEIMEAAAGGEHKVYDCCGFVTARRFAGGEMVEHRSAGCQSSHWNSERRTECAHTKSPYALTESKVSLLSAVGSSEIHGKSNEILFPYEQFIEFFNWEKPSYPPCGLKNDGNSCFANVVLQCLTYTRPLAAYFLEKGHKRECRMDKWCFLCDFQTHVERATWSHTAFTPTNILLRLNNLGGNFEHGQQEDAHEFMRFAIDKMQSVFLDEIGGEKTAHSRYQETSFVQHIFGGCLQSQVVCSKCKNVSNQFDHMMDLTVEIHGDAESLEECLDRFTAEEWLHGDNMYKCDCCNDYVVARKCLAIRQAPNILTIALKRFQSGGLNKLNKRVTFPEELDLRSYMNELEDGNDVYKLYAVIVHVDIDHTLGHYICYVKDFGGNWYRIDDDKVSTVGLDEVLSQGAYMLLYSRIRARPSCLLPAASLREQENQNMKIETVDPSTTQPANSADMSPPRYSEVGASGRAELSSVKHAEGAGDDVEMAACHACLPKEEDFPLKLDFFKAPSGRDVEEDRRYDSPSLTTGDAQNKKCEGNCSVSPQNGSGAIVNPISAPGSFGRRRMQKSIEQENNDSEVYIFGPCDDDTREAGASAATSVGLCPEAKFKPLSSLGGKRRKELFKQENGASVGFGGKTPKININPLYIPENSRCLKYE